MGEKDSPPVAGAQGAPDPNTSKPPDGRVLSFPTRPGPSVDAWAALEVLGAELLDDLSYRSVIPKDDHHALLKEIRRAIDFLRPDGGPQERATYKILLGIMATLCRLEGPTRLAEWTS